MAQDYPHRDLFDPKGSCNKESVHPILKDDFPASPDCHPDLPVHSRQEHFPQARPTGPQYRLWDHANLPYGSDEVSDLPAL